MVHILDTLTRLENKFDNLGLSHGSSGGGSTPAQSPGTRTLTSGPATSKTSPMQSSGSMSASEATVRGKQDPNYLTAPHKILLWPSIYINLINTGIRASSDMQNILRGGTAWFIKQELARHPDPLRADVGLPCYAVSSTPSHSREGHDSSHVAFPSLTLQSVQEYTDAYFNTFNILFPLLDREVFINEIVSHVLTTGYSDGDAHSVLALMVFALGQVAVEGVFGHPISMLDGSASGFRGGTVDEPPGLALFNEARRRLGFIATQSTLENVQIMLLQAIYYQSMARHLDFWRSTVSASMVCQVLIRCQPFDWSSKGGDLIKRAYWVCILTEDLYHLDLDLPQSGIQSMEDEVPLPYFHAENEPGESSSSLSEERSHFQYHFLAMIALRRLISRIHDAVHKSTASQAESNEDYGGPPIPVIREMARQLDSWRALLPRPLQWNDAEKFNFPSLDPNSRQPNDSLFTIDQGAVPIGHQYNLDIVTAQLRTRFYYARFMMYRPFVYKALHFPELMTSSDTHCCALAIKSACLWPLAMAPPKHKKRLCPHLFAWTQNFLGILLILWMSTENEYLKGICEDQVDRSEIDATIDLMLEWVKDVKQMDGIAEWSWKILEPLYKGRRS
nr:hypothetical protein CFP56_07387 [Quercus suber]